MSCDNCKELRRQITIAIENNHERNLELDALHYVWCDGGCKYGAHRWTKEALTAETVRLAVRNTLRLVTWWNNRICKEQYDLERADVPENSAALIKRLIWEKHEARQTSRKWKKLAKQKDRDLRELRSLLRERNERS